MKGLLFTLGLTYGGCVLAVFRPWYGMLIYTCFCIFRPDTLWFWSVDHGNYLRTITIGLLIGWSLHGFGTWRLHGAKWPLAMVFAYWCSIIVSSIFAPNSEIAWNYVDLFTKILLPLFVGFSLIDSEQRLKQIAWVWLLCIGYVGYEANLDHFQGGTRLRENGYFGVDNNSACIALVSGVGLAFFLGLAEKQWWKRLVAWGIAALLVHCPMFGDSRGGMMGVVTMAAVTLVVMPKSPRNLLMYVLGIMIGLHLAGPYVRERFFSSFAKAEVRDASAESRLILWKQCIQLMNENPLTGVGPDHFPIEALRFWRFPKEAHMLWLNAGAELGYPGMISLLGYYLLTILFLTTRFFRNQLQNEWQNMAARGIIVSLCGFMVSACFVAIDALEPPYLLAMIGAGLVRVADEQRLAVGARSLRRPVMSLNRPFLGPTTA